MIENEGQLQDTRDALAQVERALRSLKEKVGRKNPQLFAAMSQGYRSEIRKLRSEIEEYVGVSEFDHEAADVWLALEGDLLRLGSMSSKIFSEWLGRMRKSVQSVADYLEEGAVRRLGRPKAPIGQMCDLQIVAVREGSVVIGLRVPEESQGELFPSLAVGEPTAAELALEKLLCMASWAVSARSAHEAEEMSEDRSEVQVLAQALRQLTPTGRTSVKAIRLHSPTTVKPVRLTAALRPRLEAIAKGEFEESEETHEGTLREIDLDLQRITLRKRPDTTAALQCRFPDELIEQCKRLVDHRVQVRGLVNPKHPNRLELQSIEAVALEGVGVSGQAQSG